MGMTAKAAEKEAARFLIIGLDEDGKGEIGPSIALLDEVNPLGSILFARNMPDRESLTALTSAVAKRDPDGIIAIDHEGGRVDRLPEPFTHFPPALQMARCADPGVLREVGRAQAAELRAAGFNVNFAPVLDIHTNPENPIIGDRAFGTTPEEVIHNALPYMQGLTEGGIIGCGKHFPGHGDTNCDSHLELPYLDCPAERLQTLEMRPFARAITAGVPMLMTAHVVYRGLDPERPASLSPTIIQDCLRDRLGFRGVVVSDDLEMQAITDNGSVGDAAVEAVRAGSDVILVCRRADRVREAHEGLSRAIESGRIGHAALADAERRRVRLLKRIARASSGSPDPEAIGALTHRQLSSRFD